MLTEWSQTWISGNMPDSAAAPWRDDVGVPLRKGEDGEGIRPLLLEEVLLKLPGMLLHHRVQRAATRLLCGSG